uniref:zinc finger and BTB domain-containing protein 24 isoform X1 n=2 Tax=Myxine glutinosa TaxID=7769 RepID=UPI00358F6931
MMANDTMMESHVGPGELSSKMHVFTSSSRDVIVENDVSAAGGGKVRDCLAAPCSAINSFNRVCDGVQSSHHVTDGEDVYSVSGQSAPSCVPCASEVPRAPGVPHSTAPGSVDGAAGASYCLKDAASRASSAGTNVLLQCRHHAERMLLAMNKQRATGMGAAGVNSVNGPWSALCDVTLCAGGTRFPAHRAILAACSEYFQTIFASEAWGHPGGPWVYIVEGADGGVLAAVLDFVYTGQLCLEQSLLGQAAGMAQVLKMPELLSACAEYQAKRRVAVASNSTSVLVVDRPSTSPSKQSMRLRGRPRRTTLHQQETLQGDPGKGEKHSAGKSSADGEFVTCSLERERLESEEQSPTDEQDESQAVRRSRYSNRRIRQPARLTVYSLTKEAEDEDPRVEAGSTPCVASDRQTGASTDIRCSHCGKVFKNQHFYRVHLRTHTGERPFCCSRCGRGFSQKHSLQVHSQVHTGERPFQCTLCAKALSTKHSLSEHMSLHTGQKTFSCEQCGRLFSQKRQLRSHQRVHTGHLRECSQCARKFSDTAQLKKHMRTHTGEKPFRCDVCGKCFTANGTLTTHLRIHRGEKPYSCSDCGRAFSDPSARRRHAALHEGVRPHSCPVCPQRFARPDNLRSHMKIHAHLQELVDKEGLARASQKSESRNHMGIDVEALSTKHGDGESNSIFQYQVTPGGTGIRLLLSGQCSPGLDSLGGNQSLHVLQPTIPLPPAPVLEVGGGALMAGRGEAVGAQLTLMGEGSAIPLGSVNELALVTDDTMLTISGPPNETSSGIQMITLNTDEYQQLPQGAGCESREFSGGGGGPNVDGHALIDPAFQLQVGTVSFL